MATARHIEMAARGNEPSGPGGSQFVDDSLVPNSLAACRPASPEVVAAARKLYRTARDRDEWVYLLAAILEEG